MHELRTALYLLGVRDWVSDAIIHITCKPVAKKLARATGLRFVFEQPTKKINKTVTTSYTFQL